jgi:acetolactate synthase I/III small subunit
MRHVISALVQNQPGVLAHISGMLATRAFNIDSLAVGETEDANLSRMTFVVHGDDGELEQVRKQLDKIITVVAVQDISSENFVERDLMLLKVKANPQQRVEISLLVEMFRGRVVDISHDTLIVEIAGQESKIEAFIDLMRPYGILELARTGRIALVRGLPGQGEAP